MKAFIAIVAGALFWSLLIPARALTQSEAILILGREVLKPSSSAAEVTAWVLPSPLATGVIRPVSRTSPEIDVATSLTGNPQWFAFVDLEPCAMFEHDCLYVFIDDVTEFVTVHPALNWPTLDDDTMIEGTGDGERWTHILPILSRPDAVPGSPSVEPAGDYGDAPDGQPAYSGSGITGNFPTKLSSSGAYITTPGSAMLGVGVSVENGAEDSGDTDGVPNLVDADADERMFLVRNPNTSPATCAILYDASLGGLTISLGPHYVNVLIDLDRDGEWANSPTITEWAVQNQAINLTPGPASTFLTPTFPWGSTEQEPTLVWARVSLTPTSINPIPFGTAGWDGTGIFTEGEIEDSKIYTRPCPGEGCPEGGPPPEFEEEEEPPPFTPCPGPKIGWDNQPVNYFALVVDGPDHSGQSIVGEAADTMQGLLNVQGYQTTRLNGATATASKITDWMNAVKAKVVCQDRIMIYFVAHGRKETPGGLMRLRHQTKTDPGTYTGAELAAALALIPSCEGEACDTPNKCCNVTVILESCYSGQFLDGLAGDGRHVITTSSNTEPSYGGSDGSGGEYSDSYKECADAANLAGVDGSAGEDPDGAADPSELHTWASMNLSVPDGKTQTPKEMKALCPCVCPEFIWDCVNANYPGILFSPGDWAISGGSNLVTFIESPGGFEAPEPVYDRLDLGEDQFPLEWLWNADIPTAQGPFQLQVQIFFPPLGPPPIEVPLFIPDLGILPLSELNLPLLLQVDLQADQFQLLDNGSNLMFQGPWSNYPEPLLELFQPIDAIRLNQPPPLPLEPEFIHVSDLIQDQLLIRWVPSAPGQQTRVEFTDNLKDPLSWADLSGPLDNGGFMVSLQGLIRRFYRIAPVPTPAP